MDFAKLFQEIIAGGLFSGLLSAICAAYIGLTSTSSQYGFEAKDFWWLGALYLGFFGLVAGGILGGVVSLLNLNLITAGVCGFLITAIPAIFVRILPEFEGKFGEDFIKFGIAFIIITTLTAIFVSYIQMSPLQK